MANEEHLKILKHWSFLMRFAALRAGLRRKVKILYACSSARLRSPRSLRSLHAKRSSHALLRVSQGQARFGSALSPAFSNYANFTLNPEFGPGGSSSGISLPGL